MRKLIDSAPHLAGDALVAGLIDGALFRDQALKVTQRLAVANTARLAAATAAARLPAMYGAGGVPAPVPAAQAHAALLKEALADPDAEPAEKLKVVPVKRYAAAMEAAKQQQETAAKREAFLEGVRKAVQSSVQAVQSSQLNAAYRELLGLAPLEASEPQAAPAPDAKAECDQGEALPAGSLPTVACLTLQGPIYLGAAPASPLPGPGRNPSERVASLPVIKQLRAAREDKAVKAVVLRIDSPGAMLAGWLAGGRLSVRLAEE